jgi:signal transduction histidine kinase/CheY-like chemotaxis protein/HAMP domain-containing protein
MKLSLRIILINFVVVLLIMGISATASYSILYKTLSTQKSQSLINSANNFIYAYRSKLLETEDEFLSLTSNGFNKAFLKRNLSKLNLDFVLEVDSKNPQRILRAAYTSDVIPPRASYKLDQFYERNPYAIVLDHITSDGKIFYYGIILDEKLLDYLAEKINSDVAVNWNGTPTDISNSSINKQYLYVLIKAIEFLNKKNNFEVFSQGAESSDILATLYKPVTNPAHNSGISFLIFTQMGEAAELRATLRDLFAIVGVTGIALSLILTFLFTGKLRKQITDLSDATEKTREGDFNYKIKVRSKDEIGKLGQAFNLMLDELEKNQKAKNEYSDFITLINQNPTLSEISEAALDKIIKTCGFLIGALYIVEGDKLHLLSSYGRDKASSLNKDEFGFFNLLVRNKEVLEITSEEELPVVSAGLTNLRLKYLLLIPVVYNNNIISILELGAIEKPSDDVKEYLQKIKDQLAIGLTNANALMQLENFVNELKKLNEDYQKQNVQIKNQNNTLVELHNELTTQAKELEYQKRKAEESTELKSQFLASMSHELRTPMNSILGLTELILEKADLNKKNQERLKVVLNSGRRLMMLINDILDLSKIEAGKMDLREEEVLLEELISEVSNFVTPLVGNKEVDFEIVKEINTSIVVSTDRGKVVQVLINLLGNAIKFTDKGKVKLRIYETDNKVSFDVSDTGIGISDVDQTVIFQEFRQGDGSTSRKYGGTGLGLSICKKITELLSGDLNVESALGIGSTFTFSIPLKIIEVDKSRTNSNVDVQTLIKNRKHPILVIDDDKEVRYTIGQYLKTKGYEVIFAEDGKVGFQMAVDRQPFAITLDLMMPNKDGWTVLKELKENDITKDIPVILVSINGDKQIGYGFGAFEFFIKPIAPDKFLSAFSRLESLANKEIKKIVIVDDDEQEFEKFKREFSDKNISIEYIRDSEFAFNKIAEVQPDLVIIDLMMPKVDGITLSYKLKSDIKTKHIPLLMSTAKDLTPEERKSLNNIVENIAVKSQGHPLDVLKLVRDRIEEHEKCSLINQLQNIRKSESERNSPGDTMQHKKNDYLAEVLIVDDDDNALFTLKEIVNACNCKTILAQNGIECINTLKQIKPDLILLDIMMPGMDGFQTIKKIRANPDWKDITVYAVTAKAMANDKNVILNHGFDDYLSKPINTTTITSKINQLFSKINA